MARFPVRSYTVGHDVLTTLTGTREGAHDICRGLQMNYEPQPVDTSEAVLSDDIEELTEELACHAHEIWAQQRISEGWTWGPTRDDESKQHPYLVPYDELDDQAKQYDRSTAIETLKVIMAKGYRIQPPSNGRLARSSSEANSLSEAEAMLDRLRIAQQNASVALSLDRAALELSTLLQIWNSRREDNRAWWCQPELYRHLGRRFLKLGEAPLAREVAQTALELLEPDESQPLWKNDVELRQILALALARSGNSNDAQKKLLVLRSEGEVDAETLGILARTLKDQAFARSVTDEQHKDLLEASLKHYRDAYKLSGGFWTGINVATIERLLDHAAESERVAGQVRDQCLADLKTERDSGASTEQTYWHLATLGEAALNLGDIDQAGQYYRQAREAAPKNFGDLNATRRHACWLIDHGITKGQLQPSAAGLLDQWLPIPRVVVFSGHMIDRDDRVVPRFPREVTESVFEAIESWLTDHNALIGYSSAASGSDLLFQKAIQKLGGESRIVLPYDVDQFKTDSVSPAGDQWLQLFDEVKSKAAQIIIASPMRAHGDGISYDYSNLILHGLATLRATEIGSADGEPVGLVVWNGQPGDGLGGTTSFVKRWCDLGMEVHQINVASAGDGHAGPYPVVKNPASPSVICEGPECDVTDTRIMAMLFADAVNFSKLDERQVSGFIQHFMSPISAIVRGYGEANVIKNTWGDALYLVFDHVREAGLCALDICDFVTRQIETNQWKHRRLPENLNIRIALHAGPVFGCIDPITGQKNYTGTHVSRAARLEPKTPAGEVYASEAFAALCAEYRVKDFVCEYVKQLAWAKHYGSFPTFILRRASQN